ncbi:MAG TPA: alpha/beta hydrolase [Vicinamibacterales bacterium]|jgi:acetyl esterase
MRGEDLDPEIREFVRRMGEAWAQHQGLASASPSEARRIADQVRAPWTRGGPVMAAVTEHRVPCGDGDVRVRCYVPDEADSMPGLIYLHGGGWTLFSLDTHDRLMREYASRAGIVVIGVDYALSPEAKYPVALDQVCAVARVLGKRGREFHVDSRHLAIGGDSAGGNLATAACLRLRDEGDEGLMQAMVLNYGVFDRWSSPEARARFGGEGYMLGADEMEAFWRNYLRDDRDAADPLVCPVNADPSRLPPALFVVPACDLLTEQSLRMADRMRAAHVPVDVRVYAGASHSFLEAVSIAPLADRALAESASWLRAALNAEGDLSSRAAGESR